MGDGGFMDVMSRREIMGKVLAAMAKGAEVIKGTFTVPDGGVNYTLNFGKSFNSYLFLIELDGDGKTAVINSGSTYARAFAYIGAYPRKSINNTEAESILVDRYNPSSSEASYGALTGTQLSVNSITLNTIGITGSGATSLVKGLTYNYTIISLDNI